MLLGGDEFLRTQQGNNNAWCQDNEVSWFDWTALTRHADFCRFVQMLIVLRRRHPALRRRDFFRGPGPAGDLRPDIVWHGTLPHQADFGPASRTLAFALDGTQTGREPDRDIYVACNAWINPLDFRIPHSPTGRQWRRVIDTSLASPKDIVELDEGAPVPFERSYKVEAHSMIVLISESA
jgi:glycogen operon protein